MSDWIKMRSDLYRDPKVCAMADFLITDGGRLSSFVIQLTQSKMSVTRNVMRNAVVGTLVTVWGVARQRGKRIGDDIVIRKSTCSVIDDIGDMPGMGDAMKLVGWAIEQDGDLIFPRFFEEYNVSPSEKNAERQRRFREKRNAQSNVTGNESNVTGNVTRNDRIEKNREENKKTPLPPCLDNPEFQSAWAEWFEYRSERKLKPWKDRTIKAQLKMLEGIGSAAAVDAINRSIANGWQGIFPEKESKRPEQKPKKKPNLSNWEAAHFSGNDNEGNEQFEGACRNPECDLDRCKARQERDGTKIFVYGWHPDRSNKEPRDTQ